MSATALAPATAADLNATCVELGLVTPTPTLPAVETVRVLPSDTEDGLHEVWKTVDGQRYQVSDPVSLVEAQRRAVVIAEAIAESLEEDDETTP